MKLDKTITKVTVQTRTGTTNEVYENETLAKADIAAKYLSGFLDGVYMMYREIEGSEEVFEKQIPKKPINEGHYYLCPCCRNTLGTWDSIFVYKLFTPKYCSNCGCALDWSEVNDE